MEREPLDGKATIQTAASGEQHAVARGGESFAARADEGHESSGRATAALLEGRRSPSHCVL